MFQSFLPAFAFLLRCVFLRFIFDKIDLCEGKLLGLPESDPSNLIRESPMRQRLFTPDNKLSRSFFPFLGSLCVINKCLAGLTIFLFCAAIEVELNCIKMQISVVIQIEKET